MAELKIKTTLLLYLKAKEAQSKAEAAVNKLRGELQDLMGEEEIKVINGFKISYKPNMNIDQDALRSQAPATFFKYIKEPELDVKRFREEEPEEIVSKYLTPAKKRTFTVSTV